MNRVSLVFLSLVSASLLGCSTAPTSSHYHVSQTSGSALVLAAPRQPSLQTEAAISKLTEIINVMDVENEQLARYYYHRGVYYDSVGLRGLARQDFNLAVRLKPDMADAYNFLGIQFIQEELFIDAFESLGAALELEPQHDYARLNRAIARYYAGRDQLASEDMLTFFKLGPKDPYRVLWLFLIESKTSPEQAKLQMAERRKLLDDNDWATQIVDFYLQRISLGQLTTGLTRNLKSEDELAERLCEVYFYLGKWSLEQNDPSRASTYFKLAMSTNVYDFVEHRFARLELKRLQQPKG